MSQRSDALGSWEERPFDHQALSGKDLEARERLHHRFHRWRSNPIAEQLDPIPARSVIESVAAGEPPLPDATPRLVTFEERALDPPT